MPLPDLESKRLVIVLGKGGVGRTTVAVALAARLAARGKRTLLYQANAKERLSALLGGPPAAENETTKNAVAREPLPRKSN